MRGSCLCGGVTFEFGQAAKMPSICHCTQCQKTSGHAWAGVNVKEAELTITGESLAWYQSSERTRRGFCDQCGSSLFWDLQDEDTMSVAMGALDEPHDLKVRAHIYVEDKASYYDICEHEVQLAKY